MASSAMLCECCLSPDARLEINFEYFNRGARENYSKMLLDCFGLKVPADNTVGFICDRCVSLVRDASSFKLRVALTQRALIERRTDRADAVQVKREESECSYYEFDSDAGASAVEVDFIKSEQSWSSDDDDILLKVASTKKTQTGNHSDEHKAKTKRVAGSKVKYKTKTDKLEQTLRGSSKTLTLKSAFIANTSIILTCSNATPFNGKTTRGFRCFYCLRCFELPEKLRDHTREHSVEKHVRLLSTLSVANYMVNFDITELQCKLCGKPLSTLEDLRIHMATIHNRTMQTQYGDRDIPFKITPNSCECVKCDQQFETFGSIERHMNVHYRHYVCEHCDAGFITQRRLHAHTKLSHANGSFPCECGKIFPSQVKLKLHEDAVHKMRARFKCPKCSERFFDYYKRQTHLVSVHDEAPLQYKCNVCDRVFLKRSGLNRHTKKFHLQELNFSCEQCTYRCFTYHELKAHMIKHTGQRVHECEVCKKAYARKKTLKEHMRIHRDDRRFACSYCGQAFVQKCSLNGHVKTHHSNLMDDS